MFLTRGDGASVPVIDTYGAQANGLGSAGIMNWSALNAPSYSLRGAPPTAGTYTVGASTVTVDSNYNCVVHTNDAYGTMTAWISARQWAVKVNHSSQPGTTFSVALDPAQKRHVDSFWGKVALIIGVIGLVFAAPAIFSAAGVAAATAGAAILTFDVVVAIVGFGVSLAGVAATLLDLHGCDPFCPGASLPPQSYIPTVMAGPGDSPDYLYD